MEKPFFTKVEPLNKEIYHTHVVAMSNYQHELARLLTTPDEPGNAISEQAFSVVSEIQNVEQFIKSNIL